MKTYRLYFGKRFYQQKDGYWANIMPIHAHRWVWINFHGAIPKGMDIHHIDGNKSNNEIENLQMLSRSEHLKQHWKNPELRRERRIQLDAIRPMVHEWLRSPEGREKQRQSTIKSAKTRKLFEIRCHICEKIKITKQPWAKFCSSKCYMRWRRSQESYYIEVKCPICDRVFKKGKYEKQAYCSISCGAKNSSKNKKDK